MAYTAPLLNEPAPGWKHDLPRPNHPPTRTPNTWILPDPPNCVDEIYLELARATYRIRGLSAYMAIFFFLASLVSIATWITAAITVRGLPEFALNIFGGVAFTASLWGAVYSWRMDTEAPRDEPIRFNRLRRKVYVYRFFHDGAKPFSHTAWGGAPGSL
jgi:hypothetical protein